MFANPQNTMNLEIPQSVKVWSQFIHPVLMWVLLAISFYALYLGIQIRRTRSAEGELKKELLKGKFNVKHHQMGSLLLALMVTVAIVGMASPTSTTASYLSGPHLLAGLGMMAIIAIAASLTPLMQKGNDWARNTHIFLNIVLLGLFGWQAVSGVEILQRIISKM
jgi:magnesium-transporting ATPase (P-type)